MMQDHLSPEDRELYVAFFEAYRVKYNELVEGGPDVSLEACTVHSIKTTSEKAHAAWVAAWSDEAEELADELGELQALEAMECPEDFVNAHGRGVFGRAAKVLRSLVNNGPSDRPAPRIVEAVGVGVRVRHDEEDEA